MFMQNNNYETRMLVNNKSLLNMKFWSFSSLEQVPNYLRPIFKEIVVIIERTFVYPRNDEDWK